MVAREIESFVQSCPICQQLAAPHKEPLMPSTLPNHPWERVATDLFELDKKTYLLVVDY